MSKPVDMACVSIGFDTYLLPAASALKVVTLMKDAFKVERDFVGLHDTYQVSEQRPRIEVVIVRSDQVVMPQGQSAARSTRTRTPRLTE